MALKRKIYKKLLDWKEKSKGSRAILVKEVRRKSIIIFEEVQMFSQADVVKREILDLYRNDIEIDFLISNNSKLKYKIFPIEVKSSKSYKTTSLQRFREKYQSRIGQCYIIHPKNFAIKDGIICIPPYMTMCLYKEKKLTHF